MVPLVAIRLTKFVFAPQTKRCYQTWKLIYNAYRQKINALHPLNKFFMHISLK